MASAWTAIANTTLASAVTTVTFSSISGAYRDLVLVINGKWNAINSSASPYYSFNSDTNDANYYFVDIQGNGSSASSTYGNWRSTVNSSFGYGNPAPDWQLTSQIMDYSATDKHKVHLNRVNSPSGLVSAGATRWASTSAITSIEVKAGLAFAVGTTFALYGVSA